MATGYPQAKSSSAAPLHVFVAAVLVALADCAELTVTLLHTNDMHGHFEQFMPSGARCLESPAKLGQCVGGISRQKTLVNRVRSTGQHALFLNAGDYYTGTLWYYLLGAKVVIDVVNYLGHDVMTLGNHEFDRGPEGLAPLLRHSKVPILGCNVHFSDEPLLKHLPLRPSITVLLGSTLVGIIGFTPFKMDIGAVAPTVRFTNETECIKREAVQLHERGVKVIIAVGHSRLPENKIIARAVPEVSVIVGGRDHLFLYSGSTVNGSMSGDKPYDSYPVVVKRLDGSHCLIVTDFWRGKYLGNLTVTWDDRGQPLRWSGQPTLLDNSIAQDAAGLALLDRHRPELQAARSTVVASSQVYLQGQKETVRFIESNMGNVMAEAFLKFAIKKTHGTSHSWSIVSAFFFNSGNIRAPIEEGSITLEDVINVIPYGNKLVLMNMTGAQLIQTVEQSVWQYDSEGVTTHPAFLQIAGMRVVYNPDREPGNRVIDLQTLCTVCRVPHFEAVQEEKWYFVGTLNYVANGGDSYNFSFVKQGDRVDTSFDDLQMAVEYMNASSPLVMGVDGRIAFRRGSCAESLVSHSLTSLYSLFLSALTFVASS
ncbi:UDP-sugar hydrolase, putative [Ixodes scapularis]|uniref:UDP-sugar hydrolase, putative n=1 Tax=Ixodes scapularis TaxID=6945 RepID=B7P2B9_IXOSC|nr:UDP-sugar hydrolase, putative [Ixodes scapularis]|eukprot:XP_002402004.1 UDP-sugar hydrolase, putative [Ixodes scapularis]